MPLSFTVENFRKLRKASIETDGVSLLAGPNGAGKTTLLAAIDFACSTFDRGIAAATTTAGGAAGIRRIGSREAVSFRLKIRDLIWNVQASLSPPSVEDPPGEQVVLGRKVVIRQQPSAGRLQYFGLKKKNESSWATQPRTQSGFSRVIEYFPEHFNAYESELAALREYRHYQNPDLRALTAFGSENSNDAHLHSDGKNLFAVLRNWKAGAREHLERFEFVKRHMQIAFPDVFDDLEFEIAGRTVSARFFSPGLKEAVSVGVVSNGVLSALIHLAAVASTPGGGIMAIDEPENSLHPFAIQRLLEATRHRAESKKLTIVLATHSPVILNEFNGDPGHVFLMRPDAKTQPVRLDKDEDPAWLGRFALGDLYAAGTIAPQTENGDGNGSDR